MSYLYGSPSQDKIEPQKGRTPEGYSLLYIPLIIILYTSYSQNVKCKWRPFLDSQDHVSDA